MGWRVWRNSGDILSLGGVFGVSPSLGESDKHLIPDQPAPSVLLSYQGLLCRFKTGSFTSQPI